MKFFSCFFLFILTWNPSPGQDADPLPGHEIAVDFGSYRNRYLYPVTNIKYSTPLLKKAPLRFSARLRSYGTLFFYSNSAYDLTPIAEYYFAGESKNISFSAGIGLDARIRLVHDARSDASSSVEPLISMAGHGSFKKISCDLPLWTRFYSNGISFSVLPVISWQMNDRLSLFIRYELSYLSIYNASTHEWRRDNFIGIRIGF
jgi:hypothetical protein